MSREEYNNQIIDTMIAQLGGRRFFILTGSKPQHKDCSTDNPLVSIKLARNKSKANYLTIRYLAGKDLYRMEFIRMNKINREVLKVYEDIYCDQLQEIFTGETGLYTTF